MGSYLDREETVLNDERSEQRSAGIGQPLPADHCDACHPTTTSVGLCPNCRQDILRGEM